MINQYETVFIMTPVLSEIQMKETVQKFEGVLARKGAELLHRENWGLRKLEYPIQKKSSGFYHLFEYKGEGEVVEELELQFRRDERIMRFLTVKMNKYHIAYAEKRRILRREKVAAAREARAAREREAREHRENYENKEKEQDGVHETPVQPTVDELQNQNKPTDEQIQ